MTETNSRFIGMSIYIFITLLLGGLGGVGFYTLWQQNLPLWALASGVFVLLHIGLHWLYLWKYNDPNWFLPYYGLQTALMLAIVLLPNRNDFGIGFLGSAGITMIGEALGIWGNSRRAAVIGLFYAVFLIGSLFVFLDFAEAQRYLPAYLINGGIIVVILVVLNRESQEREKAESLASMLEKANGKLEANAAEIEALTLVAERQRMARELHDTLAQGVAGLVLQLEAVKAHLGAKRDERAAEIVEQALARARSTLADSRSAIDDLRADPASLPETVRSRVKRFTTATGIPCTLELSMDSVATTENGRLLPEETARHALHVLSEALANITRHAQATDVSVRFIVERQTLELVVRDNGRGFDPKTAVCTGHYGLLGMRERARLVGGTLAIKSEKGEGTTIHLTATR